VKRVTGTMLLALVAVTICGGIIAGRPAALGTLAGGLIALGSFRWVARGVAGASMSLAGRGIAFSGLAVGVRHVVLFSALAFVLWSGAAHPVAVLVGLSLLPPVVIALGLSAARLVR